ncbi:Gli [Cordylochernes scorpioides]|uniref:Gli n=1 Tax=Cordylochernes scorpioides TaxID=51811 RepID=A0ABY6LCU4_9ARAC|nr:Gli [Cordylochernes scorpioides]
MSLDVFFFTRHQLSAWKSGVTKCLSFWAKKMVFIFSFYITLSDCTYCPQYPPSHQRPFLKAYEIDDRCPEVLTDYLQCNKKVTARSMVIEGYNIYLCDGPGVDRRDRPTFGTLNRKPISRYYKEVSVFLGIPYARPPTKENGLRFKMNHITE